MPTQRPFLSNFLAAFRAHQQLPKAAPSLSSPGATAQTIWTSTAAKTSSTAADGTTSIVSPRPINPKTNTYNTQSSAAPTSDRQQIHHPLQHAVSPQTHLPRSPPSPGLPTYGPPNRPTAGHSYPTPQETQPWSSAARRTRRGSDSSSDSGGGFREVRGPGGSGEKWFVGGRTASGEERYYALSKIRRDRSSDRISTDQLSL